MTQDTETPRERRQEGPPLTGADATPLGRMQVAEFELAAGPVKIHASVRLTPVGFLAIGAMVTGILLAASSVVWSATSIARSRAGRRERSDRRSRKR